MYKWFKEPGFYLCSRSGSWGDVIAKATGRALIISSHGGVLEDSRLMQKFAIKTHHYAKPSTCVSGDLEDAINETIKPLAWKVSSDHLLYWYEYDEWPKQICTLLSKTGRDWCDVVVLDTAHKDKPIRQSDVYHKLVKERVIHHSYHCLFCRDIGAEACMSARASTDKSTFESQKVTAHGAVIMELKSKFRK